MPRGVLSRLLGLFNVVRANFLPELEDPPRKAEMLETILGKIFRHRHKESVSAFEGCHSLPGITIPGSVTNIGDSGFGDCWNLTAAYFQGNAPTLGSLVFTYVSNGYIYYDGYLTVYYLPGTTGWAAFASNSHVRTVLWNPQPQVDSNFGVLSNRFGFDITGTANIPITVEAYTNLATSGWIPLQTCTLTNGSIYFSDPQWTNHPARFYRIRSP